MSALTADRVTRAFGEVVAVDDVSLEVANGEVVGLVGANGAGKTTLIRLLLGLLGPDRGDVRLAGGVPSRATRRKVGYVPQGLGLWADLSLREHLSLSAEVYGYGDRTVEDAGLAAVADRPVGSLPLGLRRRAAFVVALAHRPDVLLLDEPTAGVDPLARSRLWDTIGEVAAGGAGVLVSTHYLDEAARCDRVVLLAAGRSVADGVVADLIADRRTVLVSTSAWQQAWQRLDDEGLRVLPAGRDLRVVDADVDRVREVLATIDADVDEVAATLEEVVLELTT